MGTTVANAAATWWVPWIGPTVLIGLLGLFVNAWNVARLQAKRIAADQALAGIKTAADVELARVKLSLDRDMVLWRRKVEVGEAVLTLAYAARDRFKGARHSFSFAGEGESRPDREGEPENLQRRKDGTFAPYERLRADTALFDEIASKRFALRALFGLDLDVHCLAFLRAYNEMQQATLDLLALMDLRHNGGTPDEVFEKELRATIGFDKRAGDELGERLEAAVAGLEGAIGPVLAVQPGGPARLA